MSLIISDRRGGTEERRSRRKGWGGLEEQMRKRGRGERGREERGESRSSV